MVYFVLDNGRNISGTLPSSTTTNASDASLDGHVHLMYLTLWFLENVDMANGLLALNLQAPDDEFPRKI